MLLRIFLFSFFIGQSSFAALSLKDSYESALRYNQGDRINQSIINQTEEITKENRGALLPKLSAKGTYLKQDNIDPDQKAISLNLAHSLYRGGRDRLLVSSSQKSVEVAENQRILDQINLYINVVTTYYNYLLNFNDYKNLELLRDQSKDRTEETKKRVRVGRSRRGELLQAEAQFAAAEAQLFNGAGLLRESEDKFYIATGMPKDPNPFDKPLDIPERDGRDLKQFIDKAMNRADVVGRMLKIDIADIELSSAKAYYLPTLDLASNYYLNKRTGTLRNSDWDLGLTLTLPLFEGGTTRARVREYSERKTQATLQLEDYKRSIELDVTSRYITYHRYLDQVKAFDLALTKAKASYDEALHDYRLGLINNLDVLSALNIYLDSKRNSEKTKIQAAMNLKLLEAATGVLP